MTLLTIGNSYPVVVTTMSVLSAVSTGFWSRLSDTYGRKPIFIIYLVGTIFGCVGLFSDSVNSLTIMFREFVFALVRWPNTIFSRYPEQLLLLAPFVEGVVGGHPISSGIINA